MHLFNSFSISIFLLIIVIFCRYTSAADFEIRNDCPYTVWAASVPVGGGRRLDQGQTWKLNVPGGTTGRIWARTNCTFDKAGNGKCLTGDCNNGTLQCTGYGSPPNTLAEFALNQFNNLDFFDISLVDGFNVPMEIRPFYNRTNGCNGNLVEYGENPLFENNLYISVDEGVNSQIGFPTTTSEICSVIISCTADIVGQCPNVLKVPGGCNNPCSVFKTNQYCCNSGNCGPTNFSRFFKERCPTSYSYPKDDPTSTFTCPGGANYRVVFCP